MSLLYLCLVRQGKLFALRPGIPTVGWTAVEPSHNHEDSGTNPLSLNKRRTVHTLEVDVRVT